MAQDGTFGTTRSHPGPSADLEPLAAQVISMLCERQTVTAAGARQVAVDYLLRAVCLKGAFDPALVLDELRGYRLTLDSIIDLYIPQVAMRMGEMWLSSDLSFAEVTVGGLRLQSLLGEASMGLTYVGEPEDGALHALIVVAEGEQHFLGASVVAAQLRRVGCNVSLSISETRKQVMSRVMCDQPDMVLLSCARPAALETLTRTVKTIRSSVDPAPVLALGGPLRGNADAIKNQTGVDLVTTVATDVVGFCMKRQKALGHK